MTAFPIPPVKVCGICEVAFVPKRGGKKAQKWCSPACRAEANRQRKLTGRLMEQTVQKMVKVYRRHAGPLTGDGMTAEVCRCMERAALIGAWMSPHDVITETGCTAPTTFFSDINARLTGNKRITKRWDPQRGRRGCWVYKLTQR